MAKTAQVDITVFGAGIAGLWITASLVQQGYSVALFESKATGGIQTIASQGIIHGGTKYALRGSLSESARAIGEMPLIWRACLAGEGMIDLTQVRVLSDHQHLWSTTSLASQLTGFFASKLMSSRMFPLDARSHPRPFNTNAFKGKLYQLDEPVLDIPSLIQVLTEQTKDQTILAHPEQITLSTKFPCKLNYGSGEETTTLSSKRTILAAGAGNDALLKQLGRDHPAMQLRPLHMLMIKGKLPPLFAHCLDANTNPRLTITSYPVSNGEYIWYIGGQLAENGINLSEEKQIKIARKELQETMPWVDFSDLRWRTFRIDRAEQKINSGHRPDSYFISEDQEIITIWPTKLAFAPRLATDVIQHLKSQDILPSRQQPKLLQHLPRPPLASPPWGMFE